jgi:hypothetical protein
MDNGDDDHETKNDRAEVTDGHETGDSTASGFGRRCRRRSHAVMPPLDPDSEDGKTVIRSTVNG